MARSRTRYISKLNLNQDLATNDAILETCKFLGCHKQKLYAEGNDGLGSPVKGFEALAWNHNQHPYTVVSDNFGILQHYDVVKDTFDSLDKAGLKYKPTSFLVNDSAKRNSIKLSIMLPDLEFEIDGKRIFGMVNVFNGNDAGLVFRREFAFYRFYCTNGMSIIEEELFKELRKHTSGIEMIDMQQGFQSLKNFHPIFVNLLEQARSIVLNELILEDMSKALKLSPRFMGRINELSNHYSHIHPEQCDMHTLWGIYQVMTNYISNEIPLYNISQAQTLSTKLYTFLKDTVNNKEKYSYNRLEYVNETES